MRESLSSKLSHFGCKTGSHFAIPENYRHFSHDYNENIWKKICNLQTVTIFSKAQKNGCISSKKSHFESENLPKPFSIAPTCVPEFFLWLRQKCPRYHNFKKKGHF